jgi:hypothetical protein
MDPQGAGWDSCGQGCIVMNFGSHKRWLISSTNWTATVILSRRTIPRIVQCYITCCSAASEGNPFFLHPLDSFVFCWLKFDIKVALQKRVKANPYNRPWRPVGLLDIEAPTLFRQLVHRRWWGQPWAPAALYPPGRFLVFISVRGLVNPRAIVELVGLGQLKNPVISLGNQTRSLPACSIVP